MGDFIIKRLEYHVSILFYLFFIHISIFSVLFGIFFPIFTTPLHSILSHILRQLQIFLITKSQSCPNSRDAYNTSAMPSRTRYIRTTHTRQHVYKQIRNVYPGPA